MSQARLPPALLPQLDPPQHRLSLPATHLCARLSFEKRPCPLPGPQNQPHTLARKSPPPVFPAPPIWD